MSNAQERLKELMGDTLQILDHMKVDSEHEQLLHQIINGLNEQKEKVDKLTNQQEATSMSRQLSEIEDMCIQLEAKLLEEYQQSTDNNIDQYQQLSMEEQTAQVDTYHDKIDYLSTVKIRENINRLKEALLNI
ncbi:hypothetical protein [Lederbergia graminis]|uniref:Uncharacterized protein n=1 Tax=Lederbergia graminis TaxID=735518 RepID=A0ABW0LK00_9BACI